MKFDKLTEAYMNVITEKLKTFEVYLDRPGAGWKEIVKAKTPEQAKKIAFKIHYGNTDGAAVREVNPADIEDKRDRDEQYKFDNLGAETYLIELFKAGYLNDLSNLNPRMAKAIHNFIESQKKVNPYEFKG